MGNAISVPESALQAPATDGTEARGKMLHLLAYVHLRNIHRSTGAGRVARQLTEHLARRHDVDLRILADRADYERIVPQVGAPWDSFDYRFFRSTTSRQQARWFFFNRPRAEDYSHGAQIVFCTAESYVPAKTARLAVTLHDAAYFEQHAHRQDRRFWAQRLKWRLLYGKLSSKADLFHTVSHFSAERLAHFFPAIRSRIRVVHNAVTPHFFAPVSEAGRSYLRDAGLANRPFVLVPGGLHYRKNAELLLAAWPVLHRHFPELTLAIVNHSSPEYGARAKALGESVRVLGFVPDEALPALYAQARVVWFPSRYEGFGLPVVEAMACGAPVVASDASSLPEIAGGAALLASPDRPVAHIDALCSVLEDERLQNDLREAGRRRAQRFTWDASAAALKRQFDLLV